MTMEELVQKLNLASEAYYNGTEIMTDHEWDVLFDQLKELEAKEGCVLENSPTRNVGAPAVSKLSKFTHPYPAKSLDKTKDIDLFVQKFAEGIVESGSDNDKVVVMYKEDGSTAQAYYDNGRLIRLVTRGNGEVGNIVTHNARIIKGLPLTVPYKGELVVRGEVLMRFAEFTRINSELPEEQKFKNPRNLASATLTMLDSEEASARPLEIKVFNLVHIDDESNSEFNLSQSFNDRLDFLSKQGFSVVEHENVPLSSLRDTLEKFTQNKSTYPFPVDGLVVALDNYNYARNLKGTEHHPNIMQGYALKWEDDAQETILRKIEWSPSRTGLLNPVAIFDPVEIDGTTVQRASVHNVSIVREMNLHVGDRITVIKSNMIIPQVVENIDIKSHLEYTDDELLALIGVCPTCGEKAVINKSLEGILTAYCPNENCPEKIIGKLTHFCTRDCMNIDGMSEETIRKLYDAGYVREYSDLFNLKNHPEIARMPGFGVTSWEKLCQSAEKARETNFVDFITALSIPNIGKGQAKTLKRFLDDNYSELCKLVGLDFTAEYDLVELLSRLCNQSFNFSIVEGFGATISKWLVSWAREHLQSRDSAETPETAVLKELRFKDTQKSSSNTHSSISGKSFCITGKLESFKNRQELVSKIEDLGGKWVDSVSKNTDYLINNDVTSTSGKNKKAHDIGVPIISELDFLTMIGENN